MGGVIQTAASISQLYFATQSNDINKTLNITKSIHGIVSGTLNIFSMFPIVSVISGIVDILFSIITQIIGSKTQFDYIYSQTGNPNVQYIWDGGITTSRFWGFSTIENSTIKNAKLLEPIQFMPDFDNDFYYYNNKKYIYHNSKILERNLIRDILENNDNDFAKNNNFQFVYSFEKNSKGDNNLYFNTLDELANTLINNPQILDNYKSPAGNVKILEKNINIINAKDLYEKLKKIIYYDLRPIVIMQIPKLNNKENKIDDTSLKKLIDLIYELKTKPELLESKDLLLLDGNIIDKNTNSYLYDVNDLNSLKELFIAKFNVSSKLASENMFKINRNYNELNEIIKGKIYSILNSQKQLIYFITFEAAFKHLSQLQYLDIVEKYIQNKINHKFIYENIEFASFEEIINYCKKFFKSKEEYKKIKKEKNVKD